MSDSFDRAEESRERAEGFAYEEWRERMPADDSDAYELDDPKHPTYAERAADWADLDRKRAKGE